MSQLRQVQRGQVPEFTKQEIVLDIISHEMWKRGQLRSFASSEISSLSC